MEIASYWFEEALDAMNGIPLMLGPPGIKAKKMLIQMSPGKDRVLALSKVEVSGAPGFYFEQCGEAASASPSKTPKGGRSGEAASASPSKQPKGGVRIKCSGEAASASPGKTPKDDFGPKDGRKKVFWK